MNSEYYYIDCKLILLIIIGLISNLIQITLLLLLSINILRSQPITKINNNKCEKLFIDRKSIWILTFISALIIKWTTLTLGIRNQLSHSI